MENIANYNKIRETAENFYKKIGKLFCPALKENVYFNSEGFNHLVYKTRVARTQKEQVLKFKFIAIAKEIVELSTTYQEYDENLREMVVKTFGKIDKKTTLVKYWGLVAIIRGFRVKAIIRQVGCGKKHFWSVMPTWGLNHYRGTDYISKFKGNMEED